MISYLTIICTGGNGSSLRPVRVISNYREVHKDSGSPWDIISRYIEHLTAMPHAFTVELHIEGDETAMEALKNAQESMASGEGFLMHLPSLTVREITVLGYLNFGWSEKEIAAELHVGEQSIRNLCCVMHKKFHCHTNGETITAARRLHLVE